MKKLAILVFLFVLALFSLVACGKGDGPDAEGNTYTVTWVDENGHTLATRSVEEGEVPSYVYNVQDTAEWDYTFLGWSTSAGGEALDSIPSATAAVTYYARVSAVKQTYTVSFNTLGGSAVASQTVEYGGRASLPTAPTRQGYRFVGWSSSQNELVEVDFDKAITGNTEYFAVWNEIYTITWVDENGHTLATRSVEKGEVPSYVYDVQDTAEWDYTFLGWSTSAGGEALGSIPSATADVTYYARVSAVKQTYTVSFNTLGGSAVASQTVEYGGRASLPTAPTRQGYRFVGWSSSQNELVEVDFNKAITGNTEYFAVWNEVVDIKSLLVSLLSGYQLNPYEYIPRAMRLDYSGNLVSADDIVTDYSDFVNISDITYGFGEQWYMVLENLEQSAIFFNVLSVIESISSVSVTTFSNYFDKNPADTAHYEFESGIYNITIQFDGEILYYVVDFTSNIPLIGETTVQIAMALLVESGERSVRIQLGDANALAYTIGENFYDFAIKYLGVRRAMFSVAKDAEGNVSGKIYEYLTVASAEIASAAEFYIIDGYASVVGNKADGLLGFSNTICELYDANTGKMIGYEVNESVEKLGVSINFDTLWFGLDLVDGIHSIKYIPKTESSAAKLYVNGMSTAWESKAVGIINFSRRFDIEFRTQYVTSYNADTEEYTVYKIQVPMLFVQEGYYDSHTDDIKSANKGVNAEVSVSDANVEILMSFYHTLVPLFTENKELFSVELILAYIGEKIVL